LNENHSLADALLQGAYDLHIHAAPDVVPRAQDGHELARDARQAGMAGLLIKDHTAPTVGRVHALNAWLAETPGRMRFFSALVLNPPVGGLNPFAVEAALHEGVDVVYLPTYSARHQIAVLGPDAFAPTFPRPGGSGTGAGGWPGITVWTDSGALKAEVLDILDLIAAHNAVLATGHLSPGEVLAVLAEAQRRGVQRAIVTHASGRTPDLSIAQQQEAAGYGAWIEHCLMGILRGGEVLVAKMLAQIRAVGPEHVILSSDLGQAVNGPVVPGFGRLLERVHRAGLAVDEIRRTIVDNPRRLVAGYEAEKAPVASGPGGAGSFAEESDDHLP
jgi:hypothetical protein